MLNLIKRKPLVIYFILTYVISWAFEIPLALSKQGLVKGNIPFAIHYLASFGPLVSAFIVVNQLDGKEGVARLFSGLRKWRVGLGYFLFSIFSPVIVFIIGSILTRTIHGEWPDFSLLGKVEYLPYLGVVGATILWLLTYGLGEEVGWRGFALPRLQKSRSALSASLILGVFWGFWHLPAFFYKPTYMAMGLLTGVPLVLVSVSAASIIFTWLYNSTGGSLLMVVFFHGLFDLLLLSEASNGITANLLNILPMIWAVLVVVLYKPANLSTRGKQIY
ncbi:MAG TPA: hypothetical protein DCX54_03310 [Flavobacteriales bacterium]|nr:hypothetical protein [Flavobacteriales bacterium]